MTLIDLLTPLNQCVALVRPGTGAGHSPYVARWILPFIAAVRQPNAGAVCDVRLRNLAILKTSTLNGCKY